MKPKKTRKGKLDINKGSDITIYQGQKCKVPGYVEVF